MQQWIITRTTPELRVSPLYVAGLGGAMEIADKSVVKGSQQFWRA